MPRQEGTRWMPDTCKCEIYIQVDAYGQSVFVDYAMLRAEHEARILAKDPTVNPKVSPPPILCAEHATLGHTLGSNLVTTIRDEQALRSTAVRKTKEFVLDRLLAAFPNLKREDFEGYPGGFPARAEYVAWLDEQVAWTFSPDRVLSLIVKTLTPTQKQTMQGILDTSLGTGKVKVR